MNVRQKAFLAIGLGVVLLIGAVFAISAAFLLGQARETDAERARSAGTRLASFLVAEISALGRFTTDWSAWDDTYAFVEDRNPAFIEANLRADTFAKNRFGFLAIVNQAGETVFARGCDLESGQETPAPDGLAELLKPGSRLVTHTALDSAVQGIVSLRAGPALIASRPILDSEVKGPIHGALVIGRLLTPAEIGRYSDILRYPIRLETPDDPDFQEEWAPPPSGPPVHARVLPSGEICGCTLVRDIDGKPALALASFLPMQARATARQSLGVLLLSLVVVGAGLSGIVLLILNRLVLNRLAVLSAFSDRVRTTEELAARISLPGRDEIAGLAAALNRMLERLDADARAGRDAEEQLRQAHERLAGNLRFTEALLSAVPAAVFSKDTQGRYLSCNRKFTETLGFTFDDIRGKTAYELWPDDISRRVHETDLEMMRNGSQRVGKAVARARDWHEVPVIAARAAFCDEAGAVVGMVGAFVDITERHRVEESLRQSEERLALVLAGSDLGTWDWDVRTDGMTFNARWSDMLNLRPGELEPHFREWKSRVHPEDLAELERALEAHLAGRLPAVEVEHRLRDHDGNWIWFLAKGKVIARDGAGRPLRLCGTHMDIRERKRTEEAILRLVDACSPRAGTTFFETILQELAGTCQADCALIGQVEPAAEDTIRTLAVVRDGQLAHNFRYSLAGTPGEGVMARGTCSHADGVAERFPSDTLLAELGAQGYVGVPLFGARGRAVGIMMAVFRQPLANPRFTESILALFASRTAAEIERVRAEDEQRGFEERMQQVQKLESLGVLAGGIAHDFNNLLMGIMGHAELALADVPSDSPAAESMREVTSASRRAAELCRQMLAYAGKGRFMVEPLDLSRLVRAMGAMLDVSVSKRAALRYELATDLPTTEGDASQFRQVVMNLVTNASEAIGDSAGAITIATGLLDCDTEYMRGTYLDEKQASGVYVYLEVSDTGCGMSREVVSRIFDPFFTTKFLGRGLGLSAVLGIVRAHKGAVKVYSEPGHGTTIRVLLPTSLKRAVHPAGPEGAPGTTTDWRGSGVALLVDDEETVRKVGRRMLLACGFEPLLATDGEEAVALFRAKSAQIACVVLDLTMPRMGGEEAFAELRRIRPDIPVILSSGYSELEVGDRFAGRGLSGFVHKPYQLNVLRAKLQAALARPTGAEPPREPAA